MSLLALSGEHHRVTLSGSINCSRIVVNNIFCLGSLANFNRKGGRVDPVPLFHKNVQYVVSGTSPVNSNPGNGTRISNAGVLGMLKSFLTSGTLVRATTRGLKKAVFGEMAVVLLTKWVQHDSSEKTPRSKRSERKCYFKVNILSECFWREKDYM